MTASWDAVSGATKYHVTYSSDNRQSWSGASCGNNCTETSITISNTDNSKSYIVGVRVGNDDGRLELLDQLPGRRPLHAAGSRPHAHPYPHPGTAGRAHRVDRHRRRR